MRTLLSAVALMAAATGAFAQGMNCQTTPGYGGLRNGWNTNCQQYPANQIDMSALDAQRGINAFEQGELQAQREQLFRQQQQLLQMQIEAAQSGR